MPNNRYKDYKIKYQINFYYCYESNYKNIINYELCGKSQIWMTFAFKKFKVKFYEH